MKLTHFPHRLLLGGWQDMEALDFENEGGLPLNQSRQCTFPVVRDGVFSGFVIRMQASMSPEGKEEIRTWCWDEDTRQVSCQGHWAQQMVVFSPMHVSAGDNIELRVEVNTSTFQPSYRFAAQLRTSKVRMSARTQEGHVHGVGSDDEIGGELGELGDQGRVEEEEHGKDEDRGSLV